jgi:hypothetical protein
MGERHLRRPDGLSPLIARPPCGGLRDADSA